MILSATLSKPTAQVEAALGAKYIRIKIKLITASSAVQSDASAQTGARYAVELYTEKQAFHKKFTADECAAFLETHAGHTFRACTERSESEEITILANKKGKITRLAKPLQTTLAGQTAQNMAVVPPACAITRADGSRRKNYILSDGVPVPFLVHLGVMTAEGRVLNAKYDKFRQINRFLEYIDDVLPAVLSLREKAGAPVSAEQPLRVADFGCGKSYLTFAVHYFLSCVRDIPCDVTGLDLKADVIAYCTRLVATLGAQESLHFAVGDIAEYGENAAPDIVITLHACDTATDYALEYAIRRGAAAILSVPCCQHEINAQIDESRHARTADAAPATARTAQPADSAAVPAAPDSVATARAAFEPLLRHGILKERLAALVTDALRAEYVERADYKVQVLEFIDMSHTPKNLLLRAVRKFGAKAKPGAVLSGAGASPATAAAADRSDGVQTLEAALGIAPTIQRLLH